MKNAPIHWLTTAFDGLVGFFPSLIAGLCIMLVGYVFARIFQSVTRSLLGRVGYDRGLQKLGLVDRAEDRAGSRWTGRAVFWLVMLLASIQAARAWRLDTVGTALASILAYVPHIIGAAVIFAAALYFGNWVRARIDRAKPAEGATEFTASAVRAGILAVGGFMALRELQIAHEIVTIAFTVTISAIGIAGALAFGLGSRDVAGKVTQEWYEHRPLRGNGSGKRAESVERARSGSPPSTL
jgi:hypothetical protein